MSPKLKVERIKSIGPQIKKLNELVSASKKILVLQPEKPDTDSLTSSLALEQILGDLGKAVILYCQDQIPSYIAYFEGADRVVDVLPNEYDFTILVDTGGPQMISRTLEKYQGRLSKKPFMVIDHHPNRTSLPFETIEIVDPKATSTCEVIVDIAKALNWPISQAAANVIVPGILADTRNLSIQTTRPKTLNTVADMMEAGANLFAIHEAYRLADAIAPDLLQFSGRLLSRLELYCEGKAALVVVTPSELKEFAERHDPSDLVIYEMQRAMGVEVAVVIRHYGGESNKIKISTRANIPIVAKVCQEFGGGGHDRAAGCQINDTPVGEVKNKFVKVLCKHIKDYQANSPKA